MNPWRRGSLIENPYFRTAFRLAGIQREAVSRREIGPRLTVTRRIVKTDPQMHVVYGKPVTEAEINSAEQVLLDPQKRIVEELLHHATEQLPLVEIRRLSGIAADLMASSDSAPLPVTNLRCLGSWACNIMEQALLATPLSHPSFGALELGIDPPFGKMENE